MNPATNWWLHETPQGRKVLARSVPASAIPAHTRRRICAEQGHDMYGGSCSRCGEREPCGGCGKEGVRLFRHGRRVLCADCVVKS